jgi:hypothetical protein
MTVHLVNLTNPMMMKGPMRELIPIGLQQSAFAFPRTAQCPSTGSQPDSRLERTNGYLTLTVPSILDHEVVAIDLAQSLTRSQLWTLEGSP